jgi:DNA-binding beta-propeller fold protein YncE
VNGITLVRSVGAAFAAFAATALLGSCGRVPDATAAAPAPAVAKGTLLYVSDVKTNDVYVYSYPEGRLVQTLTGFDKPQGLCADGSGDVFIANSNGHDVLEYAHGGKAPVATFFDPPHSPEGCAVDPTTGNLAVTDADAVSIYARAAGKPKHYKSRDINQFAFCGYDGSGNLFVDGASYYYYYFHLDELAAGGKKLQNVGLAQSVMQAGGVQWDGSYLAVGDVHAATIYEFSIKGRQGTLESSTPLTDSDQVNQFWIAGSQVIGPNAGGINVMVWSYPAGGSPTQIIGNPGAQPHQPFGAALSVIQ